ncbi:MAG: hypothetical protein KC964_08940 [Candidatus Omnitrophica bacterium]|nr:hypothetical protein [Candidatus Omnitrophota bacterium]
MRSIERFKAAMNYRGYDRPPTHYYGTPEIDQTLMKYLGVEDYESLLRTLGTDLRYVQPKYIGPEMKVHEDGSWEGLWGERYSNFDFGGGTYPEPIGFVYRNVKALEDLAKFPKPSPDWYDYSSIKEECQNYQGFVVCTGNPGQPDFINGISRCRSMEQVLLDIGMEEPVLLQMMEERFEFFYQIQKRTLEAAGGLIDVVCTGEDLGTQNGLTVSPRSYDKLFAHYMEKMFRLAHDYGAMTMMHSCGSCRKLIPRLIDLGLDILEVVQVDTKNMDIEELHRNFYGKIAFCGSISVQHTLPFGTPEDVTREVKIRKRLFADGGMIIAPTHQIQVGTPMENIVALYQSAGSFQDSAVQAY